MSAVEACIERFAKLHGSRNLVLGLSGGVDSVVLLHALVRRGLNIRAVHINHGLHGEAASMADSAQRSAAQCGVRCEVVPVTVRLNPNVGLEASARGARIAALVAATTSGEAIVYAHHANDQLETLLLKLMRGDPLWQTGLRATRQIEQRLFLRPLLGCTREAILAYAAAHQLDWVEDPSNQNTQFERNWLRQQIVPRLIEHKPALPQSITRAAAQSVLHAEAWETYVAAASSTVRGTDPRTLSILGLSALPPAVQAAILLRWIRDLGHAGPPASTVRAALGALAVAPDRQPIVEWGETVLRRYADMLYLSRRVPAIAEDWSAFWHNNELELPPGLGTLCRLPATPLTVRFSQPGDRLGWRREKRLVDCMIALRVPPWARRQTPVVLESNQIVCVIGLCADKDWHRNHGPISWRVA